MSPDESKYGLSQTKTLKLRNFSRNDQTWLWWNSPCKNYQVVGEEINQNANALCETDFPINHFLINHCKSPSLDYVTGALKKHTVVRKSCNLYNRLRSVSIVKIDVSDIVIEVTLNWEYLLVDFFTDATCNCTKLFCNWNKASIITQMLWKRKQYLLGKDLICISSRPSVASVYNKPHKAEMTNCKIQWWSENFQTSAPKPELKQLSDFEKTTIFP